MKDNIEVISDSSETIQIKVFRELDKISSVKVNMKDAVVFSIKMTVESHSLFKETNKPKTERPWIDIHELNFDKLRQSTRNILDSSALVQGLRKMFAHCSGLSCVVQQCPEHSRRESCCEWILGRGLLSLPGIFIMSISEISNREKD